MFENLTSKALPSLNALRAFEAMARTGRVTLAAEELNVTHSAVSRQVKALERALGVSLFTGPKNRLELTAAAACVTYVERTQIGKRPPLSPPLRESAGATMAIDQATRGNLELMRTLAGERRGSLLDCIDRTVTAAGSRSRSTSTRWTTSS